MDSSKGRMDVWIEGWLWLWLLQFLCVIIATIISSSKVVNSKGTAPSILSVTAVTAANATASVRLGK